MYTLTEKKMLPFAIYDILRKYTDEDHRLSQKEIKELLEKEFSLCVERKAVKRNLQYLIEYKCGIEYTDSIRETPNPKTGEIEESVVLSDFYLKRDFTDGELRLLIDGLISSRHISSRHCNDLVRKLEDLSSVHFRSRVKNIQRLPENEMGNRQLFYNIELIDEAISNNRKIEFKYLGYDIQKKPYPRKRSDGSELFIASPYQMAASGGKYYLICNLDSHGDVANYRLDRMTDISILDENARPYMTLEGSNGRDLNLTEYMKTHIYMYSGDVCRAKLRIKSSLIRDAIDTFGKEVRFTDEGQNGIIMSVCATELSVIQFAQNYMQAAEILTPVKLREVMKERLREAVGRYE